MRDPDVSGVDEGDEVGGVGAHGGVQARPGGLGLQRKYQTWLTLSSWKKEKRTLGLITYTLK